MHHRLDGTLHPCYCFPGYSFASQLHYYILDTQAEATRLKSTAATASNSHLALRLLELRTPPLALVLTAGSSVGFSKIAC
ncbi:hypothetical protein RIF29_28972 [Crotalaria pallida]|uniref:Uncharacterized protein n=1 Tax=Crotalaria pallida TaxID=3830 RepID=A0AAN9EEL8_CROPI